MQREIKPEKLQLHCRTCLNLIKGNKYAANEFSGSKLFQLCTRELLGDLYPQLLCCKCYWRLKSFDEFHEECEKSNKYLEQLIKCENNDSISSAEFVADIDETTSVAEVTTSNFDEQEVVNILLEEKTLADVLDFEEVMVIEDSAVKDTGVTNPGVSAENITETASMSKSKAVCKVCKRTYTSSSVLRTHMITHLKKRPFQCDKCDRGFNIQCRLKQHTEEVHRDAPLHIVCKFGCGNIFQRLETATAHYRYKHSFKTGRREILADLDSFSSLKEDKSNAFNDLNEFEREEDDTISTESQENFEADEIVVALERNDYEKANVKERRMREADEAQELNREEAEVITFEPEANETVIETNKPGGAAGGQLLLCKKQIDKTRLVCEICKKSYSTIYSLRLHITTHSKERRFQCDKCDRGFNIRSRLKHHMDEDHGDSPLQIICQFGCGQIFRRTETATAHYRHKHSWSARKSYATDCDITLVETDPIGNFLNQGDCIQEDKIELKSDPDNKKFKLKSNQDNDDDNDELNKDVEHFPKALGKTTCKICFRKCSTKTTLGIHMRYHANQRPFQCDKCGSAFRVRGALNQHIKEMHSETPFSIVCKYGCGKLFKRYTTALTHYKIKHENYVPNDRSKICEQCGKVCRNISFLKEHLLQHLPLEESPYSCNTCNLRFRTRKAMRQHKERHEAVRKYQCPHCGVRKATKKDLNLHVNTHTKDKKYPCDFCAKIFYNSENLRRHRLTVHLGIKKYKCRYCEMSFVKLSQRANHEEMHDCTT